MVSQRLRKTELGSPKVLSGMSMLKSNVACEILHKHEVIWHVRIRILSVDVTCSKSFVCTAHSMLELLRRRGVCLHGNLPSNMMYGPTKGYCAPVVKTQF